MALTVLVAVEGTTGEFDKLFSYALPSALSDKALVGKRVTVPFGRGNKTRQGMIFEIKEAENIDGLKEVIDINDEQSVLSDEMIKLCVYIKQNFFCTYFDAVNTILPLGVKYKLKDYYSVNPDYNGELPESERPLFDFLKSSGETKRENLEKTFSDFDRVSLSLIDKNAIIHTLVPTRNIKDKTNKSVRVLKESLPENQKFTARQKEVFDALYSIGECSLKELQYFTGATSSVIDALCNKGVAEYFYKKEFRMPRGINKSGKMGDILLTDEQQEAYNGLSLDISAKKAITSLLFGVTGSGKTQIFLKLVDSVIKEDKGVIITVPEIALTPQMINIFSNRYGSLVAVFHSGLSFGQRMDEYNRVKEGYAKIAIGTRSAIFAPFKEIGLIVIDEEQEHTYKSEKTPRYNTKDIARFRSAYHKCLLLLSSATPKIETFSKAKSGVYKLYTLKNRYGNAILPKVKVVDMKTELLDGNSGEISRELATQIEKRLNENKQAIILLNRRGHNTYVSCRDCGHVFECPECSISLTYHKANNRLMCHYCGASFPVPKKCPECEGENIRFSGIGTQHLEEQLKTLFPTSRVLRMDADSTMTRDSYSTKLEAFARHEYDILLGTQMVAKGLDFPFVTLVGVIGADKAQNSDDYRAFERTFSLITQVIGRAGRSDDKGVAVIQTNDPENHIIELAKAQDYEAFYNEEINNRKIMIYPPFCDICMIYAQSVDAALSKEYIDNISKRIKELVNGDFSDIKIIILGPSPASIPRIGGKYRYRMIIKCKATKRFKEMIKLATDIKLKKDVSFGIDINPETII